MSVVTVPTIVLKKRKALPFFSHHPWLFAGAIERIDGEPQPGDEVIVRSDKGEFIGRGLYNPASQIRVRLYGWDEQRPLDDSFWIERIDQALALRQQLFGETDASRACRLIFSEGDHLSGLTVDRYGDWLLVQWTSKALAARQKVILDYLQSRLQPKGIWLRTEKGIGEAEELAVADGLIRGVAPERPLFIVENGLRFGVDVVEGHKTGFYFDQRDNRAAVAKYVDGRTVLDAFCYSGGFGLAAAKIGNAARVTCVDSSATAIETARANAELNELATKMEFARSDVAPYLEQAAANGQRFDAVILDPPKMARTRGGFDRAVKGYLRLNRLALEVLEPGGILATCSCSGLVDRESFLDIVARAALEAGRSLQLLEVRGQANDHPVSAHCRESSYLKCAITRAV
ncbi:MAG: class I SAM-dependent rRNA methyltransferase [Planctomycetaceae bacterium]